MMPFDQINYQGFELFCQELIDIVSHGRINIEEVFPDESTVREHYLETVYGQIVTCVREKVKQVKAVGISSDLWTDKFKKKYYLGLAPFYLDGSNK